jgi:hypothetical protein
MINGNILIFIMLQTFLLGESFPQEGLSFGGRIGGGVISGNTAEKGSFSSSFFVEVDPGIYQNLSFRFSFLYHTDFNSILPNSTKRYYPFLKGFGLKAITFQMIEKYIFIEEGLGIITLNDRTLSGTYEWDYGINFAIAAGFDSRNFRKNGFKLSLGAEYGLTFFYTLPTYFTIYFQIHFSI